MAYCDKKNSVYFGVTCFVLKLVKVDVINFGTCPAGLKKFHLHVTNVSLNLH